MKINITKKEYQTLMEVLEMADWVLHAHKTEEPEETKKYRDFEQKIYKLAKDFGCDHLIEYDRELQEYFPTAQFEETNPAMGYLEEFEDDSFWEELTERLVERDLLRELGEKEFQGLEPMDRVVREEPFRIRYEEEFEAYGIDRLEIKD
jgi:hypothetical protein